jgi:sugar (pentulose or hexulose) kinase
MGKHVVVLDIGKTNKKLLAFDENLKVVESIVENISADESGDIHFERVDAIDEWFLGGLKKLAAEIEIGAVSITTHGATFACVGADGELSVPLIAYTTDPGEEFNKRFFAKYGDARELHKRLSTPQLGAIANVGRGIEFARENFPAEFAETTAILNYPQYFGFVLSGVKGADSTYSGCHSYLWDFDTKSWSFMADEMGIRNLLPPEILSTEIPLGTVSAETAEKTGLAPDTIVGRGIHDSNASLLPYIIKSTGRFVLNSTGTWCVAMCPAKDVSLSESDLDMGIFHNVDVFTNPVKTALFMGGEELRVHMEAMEKRAGLSGHPDFNPETYQKIIDEKRIFVLPGALPGTGPYPNSTSAVVEDGKTYLLSDIVAGEDVPPCYSDAETAYAAVNISLAVQTSKMLRGVGLQDGMTIYTEGGFRNNPGYLALLSALNPGCTSLLSDIPEATAFGAALLGKAALEKRPLKELKADFEIQTDKAPQATFEGLDAYDDAFAELAGE